MSLPDFTNDELYLFNSIKSQKASGSSNPFMWSYVISGVAIAGFAAYYGNVLVMLSAFVVVCGFRIYEERYQAKWTPLWRSIFEKYEAACAGKSEPRPDITEEDR